MLNDMDEFSAHRVSRHTGMDVITAVSYFIQVVDANSQLFAPREPFGTKLKRLVLWRPGGVRRPPGTAAHLDPESQPLQTTSAKPRPGGEAGLESLCTEPARQDDTQNTALAARTSDIPRTTRNLTLIVS